MYSKLNYQGVCKLNYQGVCKLNYQGVCKLNYQGVCKLNYQGVCKLNYQIYYRLPATKLSVGTALICSSLSEYKTGFSGDKV